MVTLDENRRKKVDVGRDSITPQKNAHSVIVNVEELRWKFCNIGNPFFFLHKITKHYNQVKIKINVHIGIKQIVRNLKIHVSLQKNKIPQPLRN